MGKLTNKTSSIKMTNVLMATSDRGDGVEDS